MRTAIAFLGLLMIGCDSGEPASVSVAGAWAYDWQVNADQHMRGSMVLQQEGEAVTGRILTPTDYPQQWNWDLVGSATDRVVVDASSLDAQPVWTIDVLIGDGRLDGIAFADGYTSVYTFTATR